MAQFGGLWYILLVSPFKVHEMYKFAMRNSILSVRSVICVAGQHFLNAKTKMSLAATLTGDGCTD